MAATELGCSIWVAVLLPAYGNYFFTTGSSYKTSTYNVSAYRTFQVSGDLRAVTQHCRRNCVLQANCAALNITLRSSSATFGVFMCRLFNNNACNWNAVGLIPAPNSNFAHLWEKLDAGQYKPKSCIKHCQVLNKGNCKACRGYDNLSGPDCDIAPKLCSDYSYSGWGLRVSLWPYGFYGKKIMTTCNQDGTQVFNSKRLNSTATWLFSIGQNGATLVQGTDAVLRWQKSIDWELVSHLAELTKKKFLRLRLYINRPVQYHTYSGLRVSPRGELSLNASLYRPPGTELALPLTEVPFVYEPPCGAFWQLAQTVSFCNQRSILFSDNAIRWNGSSYTNNTEIALFML